MLLLCSAASALVNGLGIVFLRVHPLIMTLAIATILQGLLVLIAGGSAISTTNPTRRCGWPTRGRSACRRRSCTWLVVAALVLFLLHRTVLGAWLYAIGTNGARAGCPASTSRAPTSPIYARPAPAPGVAGLLLLGMNRQGYVGIGEPYLLGSIAAVVLGGTSILGGRGTYLGTIAGAICWSPSRR